MALATEELLGVGNTAEVFAVSESEVAWLPYDWGDFARLTSTASQLSAAGFAIKPGAVWHDGVLRSCALYPRATGNSLADMAVVDTGPVIEQLRIWIAEFARVGLSFVHYEPKHILRHNSGYMLTGLSHAYATARPPEPTVRNWGPFSPVGDSPLCFWSSPALMDPAVTLCLSLHAAAVCSTLIIERTSTDVVASSVCSSTASQITLSMTDPANDPSSVHAALSKILERPLHETVPPHIISAALSALSLQKGCCSCLYI